MRSLATRIRNLEMLTPDESFEEALARAEREGLDSLVERLERRYGRKWTREFIAEMQAHSEEELEYFSLHGFWPDAAQNPVSGVARCR